MNPSFHKPRNKDYLTLKLQLLHDIITEVRTQKFVPADKLEEYSELAKNILNRDELSSEDRHRVYWLMGMIAKQQDNKVKTIQYFSAALGEYKWQVTQDARIALQDYYFDQAKRAETTDSKSKYIFKYLLLFAYDKVFFTRDNYNLVMLTDINSYLANLSATARSFIVYAVFVRLLLDETKSWIYIEPGLQNYLTSVHCDNALLESITLMDLPAKIILLMCERMDPYLAYITLRFASSLDIDPQIIIQGLQTLSTKHQGKNDLLADKIHYALFEAACNSGDLQLAQKSFAKLSQIIIANKVEAIVAAIELLLATFDESVSDDKEDNDNPVTNAESSNSITPEQFTADIIHSAFNKLLIHSTLYPNYQAAVKLYQRLQVSRAAEYIDWKQVQTQAQHSLPVDSRNLTLAEWVTQRCHQFYLQEQLSEQLKEASTSHMMTQVSLKATLTKFVLQAVFLRLWSIAAEQKTTQGVGYFTPPSLKRIPDCLQVFDVNKLGTEQRYTEAELEHLCDRHLTGKNNVFSTELQNSAQTHFFREAKLACDEIAKCVAAQQQFYQAQQAAKVVKSGSAVVAASPALQQVVEVVVDGSAVASWSTEQADAAPKHVTSPTL